MYRNASYCTSQRFLGLSAGTLFAVPSENLHTLSVLHVCTSSQMAFPGIAVAQSRGHGLWWGGVWWCWCLGSTAFALWLELPQGLASGHVQGWSRAHCLWWVSLTLLPKAVQQDLNFPLYSPLKGMLDPFLMLSGNLLWIVKSQFSVVQRWPVLMGQLSKWTPQICNI